MVSCQFGVKPRQRGGVCLDSDFGCGLSAKQDGAENCPFGVCADSGNNYLYSGKSAKLQSLLTLAHGRRFPCGSGVPALRQHSKSTRFGALDDLRRH
jgi:hypothetical protein